MKTPMAAGLALLVLAPFVTAWRRGSVAREVHTTLRPTRARLAGHWQSDLAPASWPAVSVIVPAWCEHDTLVECLDWLANVEYDGPCEIIVVAGGDGTYDIASAYAAADPRPIRVLQQRNEGGKNGAMNDAAAVAHGEVLVFLDADTFVGPGWLSEMVAPLGQGYAAVTGKFVPTRQTLISRTQEMQQVLENEARGRVILQGSGGIAVRREAFNALGGIPMGGTIADDWGLSVRLAAAGYPVAFAPAARSCSERPATLAEWWHNELRWRRIHLVSLSRLAGTELHGPIRAVRALYPYWTAWAALLGGGALLLSRATPTVRIRRNLQAAGLLLTTPFMARELAGAVETTVYTGESRWLGTMVVLPLLTIMGWLAAAAATLTTYKAQLHHKGPRRGAGVTPAAPGPSSKKATVEDVLIGAPG